MTNVILYSFSTYDPMRGWTRCDLLAGSWQEMLHIWNQCVREMFEASYSTCKHGLKHALLNDGNLLATS